MSLSQRLDRFPTASRRQQDPAAPGEPRLPAGGKGGHPVDSSEGRVEILPPELEVDRGLLEGHERAELLDPVVQSADRVLDPARGGKGLRALDVEVGLGRRGERDRAGVFGGGFPAFPELRENARERGSTLGVVRSPREESFQHPPGGLVPVRIGEGHPASEVRFGERRIEPSGPLEVRQSRSGLAVKPIELASFQVETRVVRALRDPARRRGDLIAEVTVGGSDRRKKEHSDRGGKDASPLTPVRRFVGQNAIVAPLRACWIGSI